MDEPVSRSGPLTGTCKEREFEDVLRKGPFTGPCRDGKFPSGYIEAEHFLAAEGRRVCCTKGDSICFSSGLKTLFQWSPVTSLSLQAPIYDLFVHCH